MKRLITMLLIASAFFIALPPAAGARDTVRTACRFQYDNNLKGWNVSEVQHTIHCATRRYDVNEYDARAIASRESGFYFKADNPYSTAAGVFQVVEGTWAGFRGMFPQLDNWTSDHPYNARANVMMSIKYVALRGWGPWSF